MDSLYTRPMQQTLVLRGLPCSSHLRKGCSRHQISRDLSKIRSVRVLATSPLEAPVAPPLSIGMESRPQTVLGKIGKALVLVPVFGAAMLASSRATAAQTPNLPAQEISTARPAATTPAATSIANAAISSPKVHAAAMVACLGAAGILARNVSRRKDSVATPALPLAGETSLLTNEKKKESVPEPGLLMLGFASVLVDSLRVSKKSTTRLNATAVGTEPAVVEKETSGVVPLRGAPFQKPLPEETPPAGEKFDPIRGVVKFARAPIRFVANKFDFVADVLRGKWQKDIETLEDLPEWDPLSAVHTASSAPVTSKVNKYDATSDFLSSPPAGVPDWDPIFGLLRAVKNTEPVKEKYDPASGLSDSLRETGSSSASVPKWDPFSGVRNAANDPDLFKPERYDLTEPLLRGDWQQAIAKVDGLPKWDPVSGVVDLARSSGELLGSKFDVLGSILSSEWQDSNSSLKNLPSWDPTGKLVEVAKDDDDSPVKGSKYDVAASILKGDQSPPSEKAAEATMSGGAMKSVQMKRQDSPAKKKAKQLPERTKIDILRSLTLLVKEFESAKEVQTLNV